MKELSWTPRRRGLVYCAPACGSGCTWADYRLALARAKGVAARLGAGWQPHVWENMGWHYKVRKGSFEVYVHHKMLGGVTYTPAMAGGTPPHLSVGQVFKSPRQAVDAQVRLTIRHIASMRKALVALGNDVLLAARR